MGVLIAFPAPPKFYPVRAVDLNAADRVLLMAIRWWVKSYRGDEDPVPRLLQGLETTGALDAAFSIDGLMTVVTRAATGSIAIHCPSCPQLSLDEKQLLRAASLVQVGESRQAEKVLRTTLLSAQGAEFAMGSLEGLGKLFAQARLFLSHRQPSIDERGSGDNHELCSPPRSVH